MKLVLSIICVALTTVLSETIIFDKPKDPIDRSDIGNIFPQRLDNQNLQKYPLAIEAVLSVALKLQAIEDHDGVQQNFLVSPLAVAGALGQLMLGAKRELKSQIGVLLTLRETDNDKIPNRTVATPGQPRVSVDGTTTVKQRMSNLRPVKDSGQVFSRFGTVSAQDAGSYQVQHADMPALPFRGIDGLPGLELHRQLGGLIRELSRPVPTLGNVHPVANSSYLHTASAFFVDREMNLSEPFLRAIIDFYDSKVVPLDYKTNPLEAQEKVNNWGSQQTGGLIKNFLPFPPPSNTAVIQAVAVHFRGAWQTPFIPEGTSPGQFKTSATTEVPVMFMRGSFEQASYGENTTLGIRLLAMPYANFDCTMYVILPTEDNELKFNVGHMVSQLSSKNIADLVLKAKRRTVNVVFPRLSLTGSLRLASALEKHAAYLNKQKAEETNSHPNSTASRSAVPSDAASANGKKSPPLQSETPVQQTTLDPLRVIPLNEPQSGVDSGANQSSESPPKISSRNNPDVPELVVNRVSHETVSNPELTLTGAAADSKFRVSEIIQHIALEVNEAGTEAAAIAGSLVNYSGYVKNFVVDRPFLFFIRHEATNAMLFWGTIVNPTA